MKIVRLLGITSIPLLCISRTAHAHEKWFYLFALSAGAVELLAGLMILFGVFPRKIILVALFPMNLSLTVFNWEELIGHMPLYGALAFFLIWTPRDRDLWVAGLRRGPLEVD